MRKLLNILYNFHWVVANEAARSAQPYAGMYATFLSTNGIKAVINLRGRHPKFSWWKYEHETCGQLGVVHLDAMLDSKRLPLKEMLVALFDAFDAAPRPFLIKCSGGQDRTSFAAALYLVHRDGWDAMGRAEGQFAGWPYLHFPKPAQLWLKQFLLYAFVQSGGRPLAEWVRELYDPEALAKALAPGGFNGIWEPWKPPSK